MAASMLRLRALGTSRMTCAPTNSPVQPRMLVTVRVEGPRVTREYREADDSIREVAPPSSAPGKGPQDAIYADEVMKMPKKKDNMSRDMKARLRKEYTGFGGSAEKAAVGHMHPRQTPVVALMSVQELTETQAEQQQSNQQQQQQQQVLKPVGRSKWVIDENEVLKSTPEHVAWTAGSMFLMAATFAQGLAAADSAADYLGIAAALGAAYVFSDLGTGIYHWGVDNYGGPETPFFGKQIAAFQGHHQRPWTITERQFCNNVHQVFKPAAVPAALFLLLSPWQSPAFNAFISSFIFLVCMSQQFHAWSHMKKSELPAAIVALQDAGVLISRKMHGAHHRSPFSNNYCIVSGLWNPLLDSSGFFKVMEDFFHATTGVEPRCWSDPDHDWKELERPAAHQ